MHVSLLMLDSMLASSLAMPAEMLSAAALAWRVRHKRSHAQSCTDACMQGKTIGLALDWVATDDTTPSSLGETPSSLGATPLNPTSVLSAIEHTDLIIVPALWRNPLHRHPAKQALLDWLNDQHEQGACIMAMGTGVWLPAQAGLLSHQAATTHWHALREFETDFPAVRVHAKHYLTQAGRVFCAASINSGADLMIHLIGQFFDAATAAFVEQQFSPEARMAFEKRVYHEGAPSHADESIALAQGWLHQHWQQPLQSEELQRVSGLGQRQLNRRFREATGVTPVQYLMRLRCLYAKEWLKSSNMTVAEIAQLCGFADASHCGRVFRQWHDCAPGQYRQRVRAKLFGPTADPDNSAF